MKTNFLKCLEWFFVIAFIMVIVSLVNGCKSTKEQIHTKTDITTSVNTNVNENTDSIARASVKELTTSKSELNDSVAISEVTIKLSKPDSTGQQYPEQITYRETTKVKSGKKETNHARNVSTAIQYNKTLNENTDLKSAETLTSDIDKKTKVETPSPFKWFIWVLAAGALVFSYLILKRFKLIK